MEHNAINRRAWLRRSLLTSSGVFLGGALVDKLMAAPVGKAEQEVAVAPGLIRLNSNENPYGPSEKARQAILRTMTEGNRYPFQETSALLKQIADHEGVSPDYIHLGAGSGSLLSEAGKAFVAADGGSVLSAFPTFPILMHHAEMFNGRWDKVDLNDRLEHDYDALASAIKPDTRLVFICNPNNPTGTLVDPIRVKAFCESVSQRVTVYSDEAYLEFLPTDQQVSMVELVKKDANVIVSRTFSKIYGLAGLRLGYLVARPDLIRKVARYAGDIPLSQTAVAAASASLGDLEFMEMCRRKNASARKLLTDLLDEKKILYGKSHTNFVFFKSPKPGKEMLSRLQEKGYAIRIWEFRNQEWCRVSIGTNTEMTGFVSSLRGLLA